MFNIFQIIYLLLITKVLLSFFINTTPPFIHHVFWFFENNL